jgi:hypothetical protein
MDILALSIARTLRNPFSLNAEETEKRQQPEPELPAIDFAQLSKVTREVREQNRSRETFAGRPATAAM